MATHQRVRELEAYVVPFEERECPEHTFLIPFHKNNLKGKAKDYPIIWKITYALLNAIGGILILKSSDTLTEKEWDLWRQSCTDYMQSFMPENIAASIGIKTSPSRMMMFTPSSQKLMLCNICISTRSASGTQRVLDLDLLGTIMTRTSAKQQHLDLDPSFTFDDEFHQGECYNREYKYWKVRSFNEVASHIAPGSNEDEKIQKEAKKFQKTLLAMANESCGGQVMIGLHEDKKQGRLLIKGLHLEDADREAFEDKIDEALKNDPVTGAPRVWREPGRFPEKNTHWRVSYHDVIHTPGNERRVIARIQVDHYPGGVFESEPAAYDIDEDGFVTEIPFSEWRANFQQTSVKVTTNTMTTRIKDMKITSPRTSQSRIIEQPKSVTNKHEGASSDTEIRGDDRTTYVEAKDPDAMNAALKDRSGLSWTKDKLNWSEGIGDSKVNVENYITSDSCFALDNPINFNPPKETVLQYHPHSCASIKIQEVEKYHQFDRGFVICVKSWMSHLMGKMKTFGGHVLDLLVFVQKGYIDRYSENLELHLWVICETADHIKHDWQYAIRTSLSLKQQLIEIGCPGISVICHTLGDTHEIRSSEHQEDIIKYLFIQSEATVELVKQGLSKILFRKDLYLTTTIGNQALINLTNEQAKSLFMGELSRITFIRGPPGSGKTILAQYIATKYPNKVIFICTTESFQKYVIFSVKCRTYFVRSGTQLKKWILSEGIEGILCLIFDDVHNLQCSKDDWYTILEHLVLNQKDVHLFADPLIQVYKETNSIAALQEAIHRIEERHSISTYNRQLTEVHRNTRKVTSFIIDAVSANTQRGQIQIIAVNSLDGDDIETISTRGLRIVGAANGLVILIQTLTLYYQARDIAVLLGGEEAERDKIFYTEVLGQHLDCQVHGADHNPREGVQVDVVDEYVGLDAPVVIHLNSKPTPTTQIENPKYRSFIASRGIFRVIFLVEEPLDHQHYKLMNLDRPLKCNPAIIQHGNFSSKNDPDPVKAVRAMNLEAAVAEFIDTITQLPDTQGGARSQLPDTQSGARSQLPDTQGGARSQLPDTQGGARSQLPDTQGGARKVLHELHYKGIEEVLSELNSLTKQASNIKDGVQLRQYYILCMDNIFQLLQAMLKVNTPDVLVSCTWEIISHFSKVPSNISDIIDRGVIELGIRYVKHYHHYHNLVISFLHLLNFAAHQSPQILIEDDCLKMLLRLLNNETPTYSHLACTILTIVLVNPNSDLSQQYKSAISGKMFVAIEAWTEDWSLTREEFSDVKFWLTNEHWPVLQRLACWEIKYFVTKNHHHYSPIIVQEVGWQTLSRSAYLDASLKRKLRTFRLKQQRVDSRINNTETQVERSMADKETFIRNLSESVDYLRTKLEDEDHTHDFGAISMGRVDITEKDCKIIEIAVTPVVAQLETVKCNNQLLKECQELYSKHFLPIMEIVSRIEGVSEDIIYGIWQIAMYIETALDDHTPFVDRGMVEWGVTCMQTYQHNEDLVFRVLQILDSIFETHPMALLEINTMESLKQLLRGPSQKLSVHACITLARVLVSPDVAIPQHDITSITDMMRRTIPLWDVDSDICMELHSFTDVKSWLLNEKLPAIQQLAAIGIYYFIKRDVRRYIPMMEKEVGLETLGELLISAHLTPETRQILQKIIELHKKSRTQSIIFDGENKCRLM